MDARISHKLVTNDRNNFIIFVISSGLVYSESWTQNYISVVHSGKERCFSHPLTIVICLDAQVIY